MRNTLPLLASNDLVRHRQRQDNLSPMVKPAVKRLVRRCLFVAVSVAPPIRKKVDPFQSQSTRSLSPLCAARYGSGSGARGLRRKRSTQAEKTAARSCTRAGFESFYERPSQTFWARVQGHDSQSLSLNGRATAYRDPNGVPRRITAKLTGRARPGAFVRSRLMRKSLPTAPPSRLMRAITAKISRCRRRSGVSPVSMTTRNYPVPQSFQPGTLRNVLYFRARAS